MKIRYRWITDRYVVEALEVRKDAENYVLVKWGIPWDVVGIVLVLILGICGLWWLF